MELCRRSVGIPILCVLGALLVYTFATTRFQKVIRQGGEDAVARKSDAQQLDYKGRGSRPDTGVGFPVILFHDRLDVAASVTAIGYHPGAVAYFADKGITVPAKG